MKMTYNGVLYQSESEMCKALGISYKTYTKRKYKGWTLEQCINGRKIDRTHAHAITYNGVVYQSETKMCKALGINRRTYNSRKNKGWTLDECINGLIEY